MPNLQSNRRGQQADGSKTAGNGNGNGNGNGKRYSNNVSVVTGFLHSVEETTLTQKVGDDTVPVLRVNFTSIAGDNKEGQPHYENPSALCYNPALRRLAMVVFDSQENGEKPGHVNHALQGVYVTAVISGVQNAPYRGDKRDGVNTNGILEDVRIGGNWDVTLTPRPQVRNSGS